MGMCSYCLGQGEILKPINNDLKEAEKNNFLSYKCPVCNGTKESEVEDSFDQDDEDLDFDELEFPEDLASGDEGEDENESN